MTSHTSLPKTLTRRAFLKKSGRVLLAGSTMLTLESILSGCTTFDTKKDWSQIPADKFDIKAFDGWYRRNKLYNGVNPNLRWPHATGYNGPFRANLWCSRGSTPGIDYNVPWGEVMVASAPGTVTSAYSLIATGRAGGKIVSVGHADLMGYFETWYAHLNKVFVKTRQKLERGDPIGNVTEHYEYAKLMLQAGKSGGTWLDPDNYGLNHSYMDYPEGPMEQDNGDLLKNEIIMEKWANQIRIVNRFYDFVKSEKINRFKMHHRANTWDSIEHFRYLECLYEVKPQLFPDLSKDQFESMNKEFYANQPIILTLPLVKGGMKRYK